MKKLITLICAAMLICCHTWAYEYDSETVDVFITVTDITDVNNPFNVLVPRTEIAVTNCDITKYGEQFAGVELLDSGVTYLHALLKLHENLYGVDGVKDYFKMDSDKITRVFMGRSVANVMYKNGNDIFAVPNYIQIRDGDEINVCLYNAGYSQAVASFDECYIYATPGEDVQLNLYEHYGFPRDNNPIDGQDITDSDGFYVLDGAGNIITTDAAGNFSVSYDDIGEHIISIMPRIDYFLSETGGKTVIEWVEEEIEKIIHHDYGGNIRIEKQTADEFGTVIGADEISLNNAHVFQWEDDSDYSDAPTSGTGDIYVYLSDPWDETITETVLVKHEYFVPGEVQQMIHYTTPLCVINVTNELVFADVKINSQSAICARIKNADNYPDSKIICALYAYDGDITRSVGVQIKNLTSYNVFRDIGIDYDFYKLMIVDNTGNITPLCTAYNSADAVTVLDWDYTQPKPQNTIISGE